MTTPITARQFQLGAGAWRVSDTGASAFFGAPSFAAGARFAAAIAEVPGVEAHPPAVDVRPDGVFVRFFTYAPTPGGLSDLDLELARLVSAVAAEHGLAAEPAALTGLVVNVAARDVAAVLPFWRAVLGYVVPDDDPPGEVNDPYGRNPVVCFHHDESPSTERNRVHIDVWVPHDQARPRVEAALAAGGRLTTDRFAPSWWVLADPEGNEACVATWIGTDGLGYPDPPPGTP